VSLSWLLSTASTAVAVAVQRVDGSAIDSKPMFRHLELPFSRLTVEVFSCAHTVLRMLLVFWFSAAYVCFVWCCSSLMRCSHAWLCACVVAVVVAPGVNKTFGVALQVSGLHVHRALF